MCVCSCVCVCESMRDNGWLSGQQTSGGVCVCVNVQLCPVWTAAECTFGCLSVCQLGTLSARRPFIYPTQPHTQWHRSVFFLLPMSNGLSYCRADASSCPLTRSVLAVMTAIRAAWANKAEMYIALCYEQC